MYFQTSNTAGFRRLVLAGGTAAFLLLLLRTAWLDDDAYITFRTVDNFLNGLGLRWNVVNRVQAFTHPLWMFAVAGAAAISGEVYFSSLALSIVVSLAAVVLAVSRDRGHAADVRARTLDAGPLEGVRGLLDVRPREPAHAPAAGRVLSRR